MFYVRQLHVPLLVLLLALPLYAQQRDLTDADRAAIRAVIERQLDASHSNGFSGSPRGLGGGEQLAA